MSSSPEPEFFPMSSKMVFKVKDKVLVKKEGCPPWPGIIHDIIISDVPSQPIYIVYLLKINEHFKCLSKNLFPYEENKSEFEKSNNKKYIAKALEQIENNFRSVLNKNDNHVCLMPDKKNNKEQEKSKNISVVKPNKYFSYEPYIPIPSTKLLSAKKFKDEYPIFNDVFSRKPMVLLKKFDYYIKPLTEKQNNKIADENIDTNETNSNITDKRTETFETTESALESSNVSPNNNNEITSSSNDNSNTLCVSRYGRIINKTIFYNQPNITDAAKKRCNNKQISNKSDHVSRFVRKRRTNVNSNQQKITDAAEASKDVTEADNSSDMGAASHSRDKSKSKISQLIHATSNTKNKSETNNLDNVVDKNNIAFLEAAVDMMHYLNELHNSLTILNADYITALNMLILIYELPIDMPMMLQHPIIFTTFQKLSKYVGNPTNFNDYKQIVQIKQISKVIFLNKIQTLFVVPEGATVEGAFYKAVMDNLRRKV